MSSSNPFDLLNEDRPKKKVAPKAKPAEQKRNDNRPRKDGDRRRNAGGRNGRGGDRQSANGRPRNANANVRKGGAGTGNWGSDAQAAKDGERRARRRGPRRDGEGGERRRRGPRRDGEGGERRRGPRRDGDRRRRGEKKDGEEKPADGEEKPAADGEEKPAEEAAEPEEPEEVLKSYDELVAERKAAAEAVGDKHNVRKPEENDEFKGQVLTAPAAAKYDVEEDVWSFAAAQGKRGPKKGRNRKTKKVVNAVDFALEGKKKGNDRDNRDNKRNNKGRRNKPVNVKDEDAFPTLG